ncbi:GerMN domain-containing protein [Treponema sp.]|jgi:spore germination protein GerM|uniref:GerMN domain-containing protein n=1 Tax=Treponema sp. TaxID=166 RepID=UPI0025798C3A|nr:GerMN domain-containing protein [Treponema sp.]MBE6354824.1 hypothetical protein [Treponema sp.]
MKNDDKRKKKNTGASLAVWIIISLFLLIVFIVYAPKIKNNIKDAKESLETEETDLILPPEVLETDPEPQSVKIDLHAREADSKKEDGTHPETKEQTENTAEVSENKPEPEKNTVKTDSAKTEQKKTETKKPAAENKSAAKAASTIKTQLCFMTVSSNGKILRKQVSRQVSKDSPLRDAINALLAGPTASEAAEGCQSFISSGTKLKGISISNGVAILNFSEEFEFNQIGIEGIRCQIQQIVYTATAFPTVKSVQFLIEGEKRQFVSSESSCYIGSPLNRNSF